MLHAKYSGWFGGWLAFKNYKVLRTVQRHIRVFATEGEALAAASKSRMGFGV